MVRRITIKKQINYKINNDFDYVYEAGSAVEDIYNGRTAQNRKDELSKNYGNAVAADLMDNIIVVYEKVEKVVNVNEENMELLFSINNDYQQGFWGIFLLALKEGRYSFEKIAFSTLALLDQTKLLKTTDTIKKLIEIINTTNDSDDTKADLYNSKWRKIF